MSWEHVEYSYPVSHLFSKELLWVNKACSLYFAFKLNYEDNWTYYSGNVSHALDTGLKLTSYATEAEAQTNYLTGTPDATGKILAILPANIEAKYARVYIQSGYNVTLYEWHPSVYFTANEIIAGTIELSDVLAESPSIKVTVSSAERLLLGELSTGIFGLRGKDSNGNITFEMRTDQDSPFISGYADHKAIELELMKMNFQAISWAQFAIYDAFDDETKRSSPEPAIFKCLVSKSQLIVGGTEADRAYGFTSKTYADITTVETGTSTSVGENFLTDTGKSWFTNQCVNLTLVDSASSIFTVTANTPNSLTVAGTPTAGEYSLKDDNPAYFVPYCSYLDSTNGGYGYVKMEVSFDNGGHYQTVYDSAVGTDYLEGTLEITFPGKDYIARFTLTNDSSGRGSVVYKFLVGTDPSPWRF